MKLKRTFKTLLMIIATVMSVVSGILIDSGTLAYAATTYTLTLNWDDGVEWVATDRNGTDRWEKGGSKTFQAGSKAYTYVKLRNGATVKSFFSRQENYEWTDYTYISGDLCYDTWTMYGSRNVDIYTSVSSSADVSYDWDNLVTSSKHYHSSNGNEASWSNLRDDLGRSPAPVYSIYYKLQENRYRETCYGDNQEDKDFGGYEIMLRTEDSHNSYWYGQSSYANGDRFDDWYRDEFEGIKLSNLAIVPVQIKGDKFLQINISVKNTNSYAKEISLATCSDIQVADDDNATTFFNGNGFTMTNMYCETSDNYHGGTIPAATLNVYAKDVPGYVTDADAVYIGHFVYRKEHVWLNNVLGDKATNYNKYKHGGTSGEGELDSCFSIAWKNRTIAAGQTQTYSYIIGIGKYNSDNKITFDANGGKLKTPGENINKPNGNNSNKVTVTYGTASYSSMSGDIPERTGYTFDGWWTTPNDSNASVMVYDASGKCNNNCNYWKNNQWQGTNDLTVYAHWKANTYTVNYYVRNENADGTWGDYWYWTSANYTYGQYYHADGYGNDNDGPDNAEYQNFCVTGGPVTEDKNVYIDAYKRWYHLDLNAYYNGVDYGGLKWGDIDLGTCDLYVNGTKIANDISDVYDTFRYGSTYELKNFKMKPGLAFTDLGNLTGTITGDTEAKPYIYDTYALAYYDGNGANEGNDYYESYSLRNNDTPKLNFNIFGKYNYSFKGYDSGLSVGDTIGFSDNYSGKAAIRSGYNNNLVMNIAASDNINGTNILLWWDDESNICNYWNFIPTGDGYFYIISSAYGKALDLKDYNATDGGNIQLSQFGVGNTAQQWKLIPAGNGYYYIASRVNENYRMDAWGGESASAPLQNIAVYHAVDYTGQMFKIDFLNRQDHFIAQWEEATRLTEYHYAYKFAKDSYFKSFGSISNGLIDSNKFTKIGYNLKSYQNINHKGTTGHSAEYLEGETIPTDDCNGITLLRNGSNVNYAVKNTSLDGTVKAYIADYTKNQWWSFVKSQDNTYYIVNQATGYALYNNNGTVVTKKLDKNNSSFKWVTNLVGVNEYTISALTGDKTFLTMDNDYSISLQETAKDSYSVWNIDGISSALYVNWKPNTYFVRFNNNRPDNPCSIASVIGSMSNQFFTYDEAKNLQSNESGYKLNGYKFKGWSLKPGIQKIDFEDRQLVKNLTTVNGGIVDVYAQWEDLPPKAEDLEIEVTNPDVISTTKTVIIKAVDEGSGIKEWYFGQNSNPSPNEYTTITPIEKFIKTLENKVNNEGEWYLSVKDVNGNTTTISKTFYRTTFNPNKDYIWGRQDTYSSIPSLNSETVNGYSINPSGAVITPSAGSAIRSGNTLTGWDTLNNSQRTSSDISVTGNRTYYAIWKDTINPLVIITDVSNNDADSQTITFNLYDLDADLTDKDFEGKDLEYIKEHGEKTGSDIAAYWFGKNPVYNGNGNSRTATEIVKDEGYSVNLERTVGEAVTYYIFAEDKSGNISKVTIAVDGNGKVTPNRNLTFCSLTLNANDGLIQENGQNTIQKLIRRGNTYNLTNVHAERTGYHDTESDTDEISIHWSHETALGSNVIDEDKQTVTGTDNSVNPESLTEWEAEGNDTLYAKWTPNAYTLKVYLNKPVKATEDINTYNTVSSDTNKWVYDTYTGYYKTVLVYDKVWSIPDSTAFADLTGWTTTGFKNVGKTEKSDIIYLNSLNRSYDEDDDISKVSDIGTNLTSVKDDAVAYTMLWKENRYTVNFRVNGGTAVKRVTLLEKKIDGSVKEKTVDTTASADKKATDKTYDTSIIIGYESMIKVLNSPVRPGFAFTFFTKDKNYAKTAHMKDDKPDFNKSVLCTGELSEEAAKKYREEYKNTGSLNGDEEVDLYSSWSKRKPVTLQSFISANSIRTDANALTKIALGTYITRDNAKDINSAWFNKNYKTNDKGEYVMNDTVEVLQEWNVTKTEIKQTYSKKIMADNN